MERSNLNSTGPHDNSSIANHIGDVTSTSSHTEQLPNATTMRSNIQNPNGSNYEVASATYGGTPSVHDFGKNQTVDLTKAMDGTHISNVGAQTGNSMNSGVNAAQQSVMV